MEVEGDKRKVEVPDIPTAEPDDEGPATKKLKSQEGEER